MSGQITTAERLYRLICKETGRERLTDAEIRQIALFLARLKQQRRL